jgi:GT2 family glycosyltransferase/glycosyltransferase involved in cell wall biosynthesis
LIDVIVPVYAGEAETRSCLESVLAAPCRTEFELVVVDDCSPEPSLSAWLDTQAGAGRLTLLRHARNRGFVGAVNTGLALHPDRDVVLLNSDTQVANDWLDRLQACAGSSKRVATVTPFSNNATVCSYPFEGWDGGIPGGLGLAALDRLFADTLTGQTAELPTAIGFCMFIRRACMDAVGGFDERAFGRGYGEENDFSMRAAKAGWRHLLAADVFVYHRGAVSFGAGRFELQRRAEQALQQMHPDYNARVAAFIRRDALQPLRSTIDRARIETGAEEARAVLAERAAERTALVRALRQARAPGTATTLPGTRFVGATPDQVQAPAHGCDRPVLLHVGHSWGGGVERWIHDYAAADEDHWHLLLRSRSWRNAAGVRLELVDLAGDDEVLLAWQLDEPIASTAIANAGYRDIVGQVVELFAVGGLIVSSLIGHALDLFDTGVPTVVVLHDLVPFCPALFGWFGKPCIRCDRADLARCLRSNPENVFWHLDDPDAWLALREAYAQRLADPSVAIAAPSRTIHERYAHLFPVLAGRPWHRIAHGLAETPARLPQDAGADPGRRLRIVVPGRLRPHKGLALFDAIVDRLREFADLLLLGCGEDGRAYAEPGSVKVVEDYDRHDLADVVADFAPDCALLLSTVPESFSYTLSEMAALGVPAVATRLGAFAERITDGVDGFLVTPDAAAMIDRLRDLDRDRAALRRVATQLHGRPVRTAADMVRDYAPLLAPGDGAQARRPGPIARAIVQAAAARAFLHRQSEERQRHIEALGGRVRTQD